MKQHRTQDGRTMAICEMETSHLTNFIEMLLRTAKVCSSVLSTTTGPETVTEILHGVSKKQQKHQARLKIKEIYELLPQYIMEANIRGLDFGEKLREAFDRKKDKEVIELTLDFNIEYLLGEG